MHAVDEFRRWLEGTLEDFLARCRGTLGGAFSGADLITRAPQLVRSRTSCRVK